jgi:hypothetical protein
MVAAMKSPSETPHRNRVGVPPHVLRGGGEVIVLKTPHAIADGVLIGSGGGYTPCPRVGGPPCCRREVSVDWSGVGKNEGGKRVLMVGYPHEKIWGVPTPPRSSREVLVIGVIITCLLSSFPGINTEKYQAKWMSPP